MQKQNPRAKVGYARTPKPSKASVGRLLTCQRCGQGGQTLVKSSDGYVHLTPNMCQLAKFLADLKLKTMPKESVLKLRKPLT
jgi:hypothetical protein